MTTRAQIIAEAMRWAGTPFAHQGRVLGVGVDCAGVIVMIARTFGLAAEYPDPLDYASEPHDDRRMGEVLDAHLDRVEPARMHSADVLWMAFARDPQHLALLLPADHILHAFNQGPDPRVVMHGLRGPFRAALRRVYRFRGLED